MSTPKVNTDSKLDLLIKEYEHVAEGTMSLMLFGEKLLALGLALLGIGFTFGLKEKIPEILVFQPIILSAVLIYAAQMYAELRATAGYKRYLEEAINLEVGRNILLWEGFLAVSRRRAFGQKLIYLIYLILYAVTIRTSLAVAWQNYRLRTFVVVLLVVVASFVGALLSWIEMYAALDTSYAAAKKAAHLKPGTPLNTKLSYSDRRTRRTRPS